MPLPELTVSQWLNAAPDFALAKLRGRPVLLHAFQLLCPGCVQHALPQLQRLARMDTGCAIVGLHTVFEHHEAMTEPVLRAFLHENQIDHPVGIDEAVVGNRIPTTMARLRLPGTPTLLLFDSDGNERCRHFGPIDDLALGLELGRILPPR